MANEQLNQPRHESGRSLLKSLRVRFLFWISVILLLTLAGTAYYVYNTQQTLLADSLRSKVEAIGRFIAMISPEAIYTFDVTILDHYMSQISEDTDVRFAQIRSPEGMAMTTYLPAGTSPQQLDHWIALYNSPNKQKAFAADSITTYAFPIVDNGSNLGTLLVGLDASRMLQDTRQVLTDLITIFGGIVLFLGGLIFIIFKMHVLNPVVALKNGAVRVAEGDFSQHVDVHSEDELGRLSHCFNDMMDEISIDRETLISTNQKLAEEIRQRQHADQELTKLSLAVEQSPASVVITDLQGHIEYVNPKFCAVSGYEREEVLGKEIKLFGSDEQDREMITAIWEKLTHGDIWKGEFRNRRKNGRVYWESAVIAPIRNDDSKITHYLAVKEDITERKAFEQKLLDQATHDQLTGLPNRFLAIDRLQQMLQHAQRRQSRIGIIYIDLDNFKTVNDTLGHATGDDLLIQVSNRIWSNLRDEDTLARLGGDEFMALIPDLNNPVEDLKIILDRVIASLQLPFYLGGREIEVTSSLGIALYPEDGDNVGTLMSNADMALYEAKHAGRNTFRFYTREMNRKIQDKIQLEGYLRHAIELGELYPVYHPIVRVSDGRLVGAETLLRWHNPALGHITPAEFIPIAEQTGLIRQITDWLLCTALEHAGRWRHRPDGFWLGINVPPTYFCEDPFHRSIEASAQQAAANGLGLCVEITENLFLQNGEGVIENFKRLADLGVTTAMDDFGTGYSSLAYIKRFPLTYLKIDRTFVDGLPGDPEDRSLTETIALMGQRLGIKIIAEGVESREQLDYLRTLDVDYAQGYYIAEPKTHEEFARYLGNASDRISEG